MKIIIFNLLFLLCANAVFAQSDTIPKTKTHRPARHFLGVSSGVGVSSFGVGVPLSLDYDIIFPKTVFGLTLSVATDNYSAGNSTFSMVGISSGIMWLIPYSKKDKQKINGFAIKLKSNIGVASAQSQYDLEPYTSYTGSRSVRQVYDPFPFYYNEYDTPTTTIRRTKNPGIALGLEIGLDTRFQLGRNFYILGGIDLKVGGFQQTESTMISISHSKEYKGRTWTENESNIYYYNRSDGYAFAQLRLGAGFILRGRQPK